MYDVSNYTNTFPWSVSPGNWYRTQVITYFEYSSNGPFYKSVTNSQPIYALYGGAVARDVVAK